MRIAWNVRLAGCPPVRRAAAGIAAVTIVGQLGGRLDRPGGDDRPGDPAGEALVAVAGGSPARSSSTVVAVDHVGRRPRRVGVHAHVERSVVAVREAALGAVELRRRDAEVEQRAAESVDRRAAAIAVVEVVEAACDGVENAVTERLEPGRRRRRARPGRGRGRATDRSGRRVEHRLAVAARRRAWRRARHRPAPARSGDDLVDASPGRWSKLVLALAGPSLVASLPRRRSSRRPRRRDPFVELRRSRPRPSRTSPATTTLRARQQPGVAAQLLVERDPALLVESTSVDEWRQGARRESSVELAAADLVDHRRPSPRTRRPDVTRRSRRRRATGSSARRASRGTPTAARDDPCRRAAVVDPDEHAAVPAPSSLSRPGRLPRGGPGTSPPAPTLPPRFPPKSTILLPTQPHHDPGARDPSSRCAIVADSGHDSPPQSQERQGAARRRVGERRRQPSAGSVATGGSGAIGQRVGEQRRSAGRRPTRRWTAHWKREPRPACGAG